MKIFKVVLFRSVGLCLITFALGLHGWKVFLICFGILMVIDSDDIFK